MTLYRCTCCRRQVYSGGDDELEEAFFDATAAEDTGLCDDCWVVMDRARAELVQLALGWLAA